MTAQDTQGTQGPPGSHGDRGGEVGPVWAPSISGSSGVTSTLDDVKDRLRKAGLYAQESREIILTQYQVMIEMQQGIAQQVQYLSDRYPNLAGQIHYLHQQESERHAEKRLKAIKRSQRNRTIKALGTIWGSAIFIGLAMYGVAKIISDYLG